MKNVQNTIALFAITSSALLSLSASANLLGNNNLLQASKRPYIADANAQASQKASPEQLWEGATLQVAQKTGENSAAHPKEEMRKHLSLQFSSKRPI